MNSKNKSVSQSRHAVRMPFRLANASLAFLEQVCKRSIFHVSPDDIIRAASRATHVKEVSRAELWDPLKRICDSLSDQRLMPLARLYMSRQLVARATTRLCIDRCVKADPGILEEPISEPWFITGMHRSGTTLLHRLLAQDPENRAPLLWETYEPVAKGPRSTIKQRRSRAGAAIRFIRLTMPKLTTMHELDAELPEECSNLLANSLIEGMWIGGSEEFQKWLVTVDRTPSYRLHRIQLQCLQRGDHVRRWILKDPIHLTYIEALMRVYPDAWLIQLHRDPTEVLASHASLIHFLLSSVLWEVDPRECGLELYEHAKHVCYSGFNSLEQRTLYGARGLRVVDVRYTDLMTDPIETVKRIYQAIGRVLSHEAEARMNAYLRKNPRHKHGTHTYTLEQFGLSRDIVLRECANYIEQYV